MPNADIIGLNGFGITEDEQLFEIVFGITICTYNDPNVFRCTEFSDTFFKAMRAQKQFKLYNPETAGVCGVATFTAGTSVTPVQRVEVRPTMSIACSAKVAVDAELDL